ncbi:D-alanyl-D-alanine carboxypeptidase [Streptomyces sp. NBS 14/10]|uniref:D-alanyl-D-alanine carboxypeptidase family protein n=1 Tax=Streptomyces sp. NBS 14/10 TaxID=1945643 RepID=UPI000B7DAD02|nr:D-alanyl-D-alanine carboxypeptidase [Streptomyces sp. NBS 14/10]KAK1180404.1 D-alanyl-D-alanine carboxypeptidase [Streptomyces sp. NBS 14/10]NUP41593.1 D-alanyl-D-alanine carboxypeptidase [Streptomyces sp.]NUS87106.1 D-alanyl-D-alanine carboxypeptidase [Streptomyces sp.]
MKTGIKGIRRVSAVAVIAAGAVLSAGALAPVQAATVATPTITAKGGFVMNNGTGKSLYTKAADTRLSTGSTTKIMTARVVLAQPNLNLDAKVTVQKAYSDYIVDNNWASSAKLIVGDKVTVRQLLYGLMLPSGCDAAYALADKFGTGSTRAARVKSFIGKMNTTAKSLGLTNTHFDSFDGIGHGANYSTPRDLTKLASSAMKYSTFRTVVKTKSTKQKVTTKSGGYRYMDWTNTNPLLGTYSGAIGVKTGSGPEAKYCLVFAATRDSKTVIGTVLASSSVDNRTADAKKLLNYGFAK